MQIVCPNCVTSYRLASAALGPAGRSVRCVRCQTVWFAASTDTPSDVVRAHQAEMAQLIAASSMADAPADTAEVSPGPLWAQDPDEVEPADERVAPAADIRPEGSLAIADSPPIAPLEQGAAAPEIGGEDIESVAARRSTAQRRRRLKLPKPGLYSLIAVLAAILAGLIGLRTAVVRLTPQTAPLYAAIGLPVNVRGLIFTDLTTETQIHDNVHVLMIQGKIASISAHVVEVPRLRFTIRDGVGNEIYTWTALPSRSILEPGQTLEFQSRLSSPPTETGDVLVRFISRDSSGGIE